jgi:hemerythrin
MELFTWYAKYSVNNEELDNHHKALFDIFNRLYYNCVDNNNSRNIDQIIDELVSYTKYHFSAEEKYMIEIGYKDINKHILEHRLFTDRILDYQSDTNMLNCENSKELIAYLGNWLLNHVMEEDKKYSI